MGEDNEGMEGIECEALPVDRQSNKWEAFRIGRDRLKPEKIGRLTVGKQAGPDPEVSLVGFEVETIFALGEFEPVIDDIALVVGNELRQGSTSAGTTGTIDGPPAFGLPGEETGKGLQIAPKALVGGKMKVEDGSFVRHGIPLHGSHRPTGRRTSSLAVTAGASRITFGHWFCS
ncbi:MAG: hypothetical protein ACOYLF_02700 [Blastocatellia bacterium]